MKRRLLLLIAGLVRAFRGEVSTQRLIKKGLRVGKNFSREGGVRIDTSLCYLIKIGNNVTFSTNVTILAHDASLKNILGIARIGSVEIGDNVFIGSGSIILPNVRIGNNVVVGAGSVVNRDIPDNCVYAGNPAKFIRSIDEYKQNALEYIRKNPLLENQNTKTVNEVFGNSIKNEARFVKCHNFKQFELQFCDIPKRKTVS